MSVIARHPPSPVPLDHTMTRTTTFNSPTTTSTSAAVAAAAEDIIISSSTGSLGSLSSLNSSSASNANNSSNANAPVSPNFISPPPLHAPKSTPIQSQQSRPQQPVSTSPSKLVSNPLLTNLTTSPPLLSPISRPSGPVPISAQPLSPNTMAQRLTMVTSGAGVEALSKSFARDDLETVTGSGLEPQSTLVRNLSVLIVPVDGMELDLGTELVNEPEEETETKEDEEVEVKDDMVKAVDMAMSPMMSPMNISEVTTTTTTTTTSKSLGHHLTWSVATEKGYRRILNMNSVSLAASTSPTTANGYPRHPIHSDLEDVHWPPAVADVPDLLAAWSNPSASFSPTSSVPTLITGESEEVRRVRSRSDIGNGRVEVGLRTSSSESELRRIGGGKEKKALPDGAAIVEEGKGGVVKSMVETLSGTTRLFLLADGHGGVSAARFFVPRVRDTLLELMTSRLWDFSVEKDRLDFTEEAGTLFKILDTEYCAIQVAAYRRWVDAGSVHGSRPADDGCTMVVVVVHGGHAVCLNVGDSRAVIVSREEKGNKDAGLKVNFEQAGKPALEMGSRWTAVFSTDDHNMAHPGKVWDIHRSGGHFINPNGTLKHVVVNPPEERRYQPYDELNGARIYRHPTDAVRAVGVSHKRTLNLTATMGDLLFKIEPSVLSPVPDVRFVSLEADKEYVILLATDGVWDHLRTQGSQDEQNLVAAYVVASAIESMTGEENDMGLLERLEAAAKALVLRETDVEVSLPGFVRHAARDLFSRGQIRYDDATALVVHLEPRSASSSGGSSSGGSVKGDGEKVAAAALV
ncbi:Protein phosphatase 1D [Phlyctochytrium planicorne]|nr:Protein phosphatase 1D [Phlyctochytrium planicorne]